VLDPTRRYRASWAARQLGAAPKWWAESCLVTWFVLHLSRLHRHSKDAHVSHFSSNFKLSSSRWALNSSSSEAGSLLVRRPRDILPSRSCCSSCASCSTTSALVSRLLILSVAMVCHFGRDEERQFACAVPKWCENRVFPTKNARPK